ncbi:hypothetical protein DFH08DRAFT_875920 [Mycena albidolilacea]|uniref:Uncharacterized protein n=1 Tax=Mycena albidolilacea TaxID=1033008 RepID=A0AAD6ZUI0_9AGAR|nr:hypothetical protein DFH08DRAFT_875920 [Mycena albidolilacea]
MTEVLRALCRHAPGWAPDSAPDTTPILPPSPSATTTPHEAATYAQATSCTAPDPPVTPKIDERSHSPPSERFDARNRAPDLVFRFDLSPAAFTPTVRPSPAQLFFDITKKSVIGNLQLAGIRWTPRGNLTFAFLHDEKFTAEEARKQAPAIWNLIRPLLKQRKPSHCPRVDGGNSWHNVVIHGVPVHVMPPNASNGFATPQESATVDIHDWLKKSGIDDCIQAMSFMCSDTDLAARETAPLRVSLLSKKDADSLVRNGALVLGSRCRVSPYVAKTPL